MNDFSCLEVLRKWNLIFRRHAKEDDFSFVRADDINSLFKAQGVHAKPPGKCHTTQSLFTGSLISVARSTSMISEIKSISLNKKVHRRRGTEID